MREIYDAQLKLEFYKSNSKISKKLEKAAEILEKDKSFLEIISKDFSTPKNSKAGAKGLTIEQVTRIAILKQTMNLSYDDLYDQLNDNISYRRFSKIDEEKVPKKTALNENIKRLSAKSLEALNNVIIKVAMDLKVEKGEKIRIDSTGVESNIHYPTDSELLGDCIRVIDRLIEEVLESCPGIGLEYHDHTRRAKKRRYKIINTNSKEKRKECYEDLLKVSEKVEGYTVNCIELLSGEEYLSEIELMAYKETLEGYLESLRIIINQTRLRVLEGEKVEAKDKLVSIFETHADILTKGKRDTIFGHKVLLSGGSSNLILDCVIERGNWSDAEIFANGLDRVKSVTGVVPKELTTDGGFASNDNYDYATGEGVKRVLFTKKSSANIVELVRTSQAYKKMQKFRAGIEGCISAAKRAFGLSRCTWKGWESFQSYVWLSVISFNISVLTDALLK